MKDTDLDQCYFKTCKNTAMNIMLYVDEEYTSSDEKKPVDGSKVVVPIAYCDDHMDSISKKGDWLPPQLLSKQALLLQLMNDCFEWMDMVQSSDTLEETHKKVKEARAIVETYVDVLWNRTVSKGVVIGERE